MDLEREKGITIQSAATFCDWKATEPGQVENKDLPDGGKKNYAINIIDTPGQLFHQLLAPNSRSLF